ncbi:MAG: efflux RND transporter periplasmic adaptor subunit, partial [Cyanobacteria bacterium J06555_13]
DVLAVLDNRILRSQLAQAEARMAQAQSDLQQKTAVLNQAEVLEQAAATEVSRYATLYAQGAISQEQLGQRQVNTLSAQQNVAAARAALDSAHAIIASQMADISRVQAQLDQAVVVAPTAGTIAERLTTLGNTATVDTPIYSLIEDSQLMLAVTPSQAQLRQIEVGSTVAISTTDTNNPLQLRGEVDTIEPTIDANSRQALVKISLPEEAVSETGNRLHSGMFLRAQLVTGRRRSVVVPATAVIAQPDGTAVVYTVSDRADSPTTVSANWVTVASRPAGDNTVEVVAGLEPGSRVVVGGASYIQPGDTVTTVPQAASATDL